MSGIFKGESSGGFQDNLTGAVDPTPADDTGKGYSVGSRWINLSTDKEFVCLDSSLLSAVWTETTGAGAGGNPNLVSVIAGETLSGHVGVVLISNKIYLFDPTNPAHYGIVHGVTTGAITINNAGSVIVRGQITNAGGWSLSSGAVYLGAGGQITNSAPVTGIVQPAGYAVDTDTVFVDIQHPIQQL